MEERAPHDLRVIERTATRALTHRFRRVVHGRARRDATARPHLEQVRRGRLFDVSASRVEGRYTELCHWGLRLPSGVPGKKPTSDKSALRISRRVASRYSKVVFADSDRADANRWTSSSTRSEQDAVRAGGEDVNDRIRIRRLQGTKLVRHLLRKLWHKRRQRRSAGSARCRWESGGSRCWPGRRWSPVHELATGHGEGHIRVGVLEMHQVFRGIVEPRPAQRDGSGHLDQIQAVLSASVN